MKSIKEITRTAPVSKYTGSEATRNLVAEQIKERWGEKEVRNYDPYTNTLTYKQWLSLGFKVRPGEKSLKSYTIIDIDENDGHTKKVKRGCSLFYKKQVEKITPLSS